MQVTSRLVVERLASARRCSGCGALYDPQDIHVLARQGQCSWELAAVCRSCCTLTLFHAFVTRRASRRSWAPPRGESSAHELARFWAMPPVDQTDVQRATEFLAAFDGDFRQLFGHSVGDGASGGSS